MLFCCSNKKCSLRKKKVWKSFPKYMYYFPSVRCNVRLKTKNSFKLLILRLVFDSLFVLNFIY